MPNSLGKYISSTIGRRLVISDVHGCFSTLSALLYKLQIQSNDQVFLLGDYVNKGPKSLDTLDLILHLNSLPNYFALLGNHDQLLLDYLTSGSKSIRKQLIELNNSDFFEISHQKKMNYVSALAKLPCYLELDNYLLVHAGFNFHLKEPFHSKEDMLMIREFIYHPEKAHHKQIIHGHYPHDKKTIVESIVSDKKIIPLDNGCVYAGHREGMGELLCLNLDNKQLFSQSNID